MDGAFASRSSIPGADLDILGLAADSRAVRPGYLFAALAGSRTDGRRFIADAVARGAAAVLVEDAVGLADLALRSPPVRVIADPNPRRRLALMAARFFAPQPKTVVAVTGTNGKTSVAEFTRQIWRHQGLRAASLGTIGIIGPDFVRGGGLTSPDPVTLHRELQGLARTGIGHVALEASSHGLDQHRLDGLVIAAAAFTNLSRDHLDYHRDLDAYFAAKARLFAELLASEGSAVLNADAPESARLIALCRGRGLRTLTFGRTAAADIRLLDARAEGTGQAITIDALGARRQLLLPLLGDFQAANALAALGLAIATQTPIGMALDALEQLQGVPGRMERVATHPSGAPVIVDYAHTPDALETALLALRPHCRGRLIVVFGCGGDRDPGKRPQMGAIAARRADLVIVTDDNPRGEDPREIRRAILAQCQGAREIGERAAAIGAALDLLAADDVLLIAGKGHESGQIVGDKVLPFNDAEAVRLALAARAGGSK
ncbi:MAG TPA: UDP-N-acetylmuramoyl-L-alanyl-D-glutamate--2,6-diaminopimelate ligase [Stellaceae bacterium]|nr:UDP-N-acetylmuramoyl-L-alanyl-D-glutamate--2,6-diaminopimelate ligase [Stellaceae bacterium]